MLRPDEVAEAAAAREDENLEFRTFLKAHAREQELDRQFAALHQKYFADYDCSACRNCCRLLPGSLTDDDAIKAAGKLNMYYEGLVELMLIPDAEDDGDKTFTTKHTPCDFLGPDGNCTLEECRPEGCIRYPFTDQPGRLSSLYSMISAVGVCPVAYQIWEDLKELYGFRPREKR